MTQPQRRVLLADASARAPIEAAEATPSGAATEAASSVLRPQPPERCGPNAPALLAGAAGRSSLFAREAAGPGAAGIASFGDGTKFFRIRMKLTDTAPGEPGASAVSSPRLVVIAASAGGLSSIREVLGALPPDYPAAIALVQHRGDSAPERLVEILASATRLRVCHARDGAALEPGTVYVCPPRVHMTAEHCARLLEAPRIDFVQPNADLMFESVARSYRERALGVVLSGCGADAALGSLAIAQAGGIVLAQDERTSAFAGMPLAAVKTGAVEKVLSPLEIAEALCRWVRAPTRVADASSPARGAASVIKVLIADDHKIVLEGLRVLLEGEPDLLVVASVEDGAAAVRMSRELSPDVVVMDIRMPGVDGVEATRQILAHAPSIRVVALSAESDTRSVDGIFRAGAAGYLTKQRAFAELVQAIRGVMQGKIYLSREIARLVARGLVAPPSPSLQPSVEPS